MLAVKERRPEYDLVVQDLCTHAVAASDGPLSTQRVADTVSSIVRSLPVKTAYLFGSYARGEQTPTSDVDIFVVPDAGFSFSDRTRIKIAIERCLGLQSDVLTTLNGRKTRFVDAVKRDAVKVYDLG